MLLEPVRHRLIEQGLLGEKAGQYGGPDEVMLVSAGPTSHLSQFSLLCGPASRRVLIRQPPRDVVEAAKEHSPLSGKTKLVDSAPFLFEREIWDGAQWQLDASTTTISLADGLRQLCLKTDSNFLGTIPESIPFVGPFWTGALSYDYCNSPNRFDYNTFHKKVSCCVFYGKSITALFMRRAQILSLFSQRILAG